mmetsp:Transcript_4459/g.6776  ORF Transcript_4459/g.6776 Transcript_4459/m.6776 type:complete len:270 (+) Transcript_4459:64-873(+)|eukprot:CAMPEP_0171459774 /NCGR_PEP_ID=MMETSP0945-20130129/4915_1 /TAXON_ID=109269 /ORGANISM="Vaucheria litorea, Strain CCMP2940" /LENGTH=269 /DNA_ID=CAMNT_0011985843 /DNA_START=138 /DNA_END=944 /DNA_ORIENTATION=+
MHLNKLLRKSIVNSENANRLRFSSVVESEVLKFQHIKEEWWNSDTKAGIAPLHSMNIQRTNFIVNNIDKNYNSKPLEGFSCLDVGCGGGLLTESLSRLGGKVKGIDPSEENIKVAMQHAIEDPLTRNISYEVNTAESESDGVSGGKFDIVCALEVVEHVSNVGNFIKTLSNLVLPGGYLFISTINRTSKSYLIGIIGAEYITGIIKPGTHNWDKFITPRELMAKVRSTDMKIKKVSGINYDILNCKWILSNDDMNMNYILCAQKSLKDD